MCMSRNVRGNCVTCKMLQESYIWITCAAAGLALTGNTIFPMFLRTGLKFQSAIFVLVPVSSMMPTQTYHADVTSAIDSDLTSYKHSIHFMHSVSQGLRNATMKK